MSQLRTAVVRIALANPHLIAARVAEIAGCAPQQAGYFMKTAGISAPKAKPGNGLGRKTGPKPSAKARNELTAEMLRADLHYSPDTGAFRWRTPRPKIVVGSIAGTLQSGYWTIHLRGEDYHAHRLAWLYEFGRWPTVEIDHINRDKLDNRLCNLREASRSQNNANIGLPAHNTSGFKGVSYFKQTGKWTAYITRDGKRRHLGTYTTAEAAAAAYDQAAIALFGRFARTNKMIKAEAA